MVVHFSEPGAYSDEVVSIVQSRSGDKSIKRCMMISLNNKKKGSPANRSTIPVQQDIYYQVYINSEKYTLPGPIIHTSVNE